MIPTTVELLPMVVTVILLVLTGLVFLPFLWKPLETTTFFRWYSVLVTVILVGASGLALIPATRGPGLVLLFLTVAFALYSYGGYLSYVRGQLAIGSEITQGVKWMVVGILLASIGYVTSLLPSELFFVIPVGFTAVMIGYRIATIDRPRPNGVSTLEFVLIVCVIAAALGVQYVNQRISTISVLLLGFIVFSLGWQMWRRANTT